MNIMEEQNNGSLYIDPSRKVKTTLSPKEMKETLKKLEEIMKIETSVNLDIYAVFINNREVWGVLDRRAGPNGVDLLSIIFLEEFKSSLSY